MKAYPVDTRANARRLREQGLGYKLISRELGVGTTTIQRWLKPDFAERQRAQSRARKQTYRRPCPKCGALMDGSCGPSCAPTQCAACAAVEQHEQRYWTPERIIECFQEFHRITGRSPAVTDVYGLMPSIAPRLSERRRHEVGTAPELPFPQIVQREFPGGGWREAVLAAGLQPAATGGLGHRDPPRLRKECLEALALLEHESLTISQIASARGVTYVSAREMILRLQERGLVEANGRATTRGRPRYYAPVK